VVPVPPEATLVVLLVPKNDERLSSSDAMFIRGAQLTNIFPGAQIIPLGQATPSFWHSLPASKRLAGTEKIMGTEHSPGHEHL